MSDTNYQPLSKCVEASSVQAVTREVYNDALDTIDGFSDVENHVSIKSLANTKQIGSSAQPLHGNLRFARIDNSETPVSYCRSVHADRAAIA